MSSCLSGHDAIAVIASNATLANLTPICLERSKMYDRLKKVANVKAKPEGSELK